MEIAAQPLVLKFLRQLPVERPLMEGGPKFLAAGSAITAVGNELQIVADDAIDLVTFERDSTAPGRLTRLFERPNLPLDHDERKELKPDLEAATIIGEGESSTWMGLGSGSTGRRMSGVWMPRGQEPIEFDLEPLYNHLKGEYPKLNIEGCSPIVEENRLRLAQRGNGKGSVNALIDLDLKRAVELARNGQPWGPDLILDQKQVNLPQLECPPPAPGERPGSATVPLTLTDLTPLDGKRCLFTAAAEDTSNPYDDGKVVGSAIGVLEFDGTVSQLHKVDQVVKLEGITARRSGDQVQALVVTDNDDPTTSASLYETWLTVPLQPRSA